MKRPPGTERPLDPTLGYPARGPTIWRRRSNSGRDNLIGRRPVPGPAPMPAGLGGYQGKGRCTTIASRTTGSGDRAACCATNRQGPGDRRNLVWHADSSRRGSGDKKRRRIQICHCAHHYREGGRVRLSRAWMSRKTKPHRHVAELRLFCGSDHSWPGRERGALPGWYHHPDTRGRKHRFEMVRHFSERAHSCLGYARAESWTITIVWRSAVLVYPRKLGPFRTVLGPASRRRPRWRRGRKIG